MTSRRRGSLGTPFPFRVPRQPQGEPFPTASEDFAYQVRGTNDTPGVDAEGLYACTPDEADVWAWRMVVAGVDTSFISNIVIDEGTLDDGDVLVYLEDDDTWVNRQQHPFIVSFVLGTTAANPIWTNMPLALTEVFGSTNLRKRIDLTAFTRMRLHVEVITPGASGATLDIQYSQDILTPSWVSTNCDVGIDFAGWTLNPEIAVPTNAKEDVLLRIVGEGGDGAADPEFANIYAEFH